MILAVSFGTIDQTVERCSLPYERQFLLICKAPDRIRREHSTDSLAATTTMAHSATIFLFPCLLLSACENNLLLAPTPVPRDGVFVVDEFTVSTSAKRFPPVSTRRVIIEGKVIYRFENRRGSPEYSSVAAANIVSNSAWNFFSPQPMNIRTTLPIGLSLMGTLPGMDSLTVYCSIRGRFWDKFDWGISEYGIFVWRDSARVQIIR